MDAGTKKHARMNNLTELLPGANEAIQGLIKAAHSAGVPMAVLELAHMRASLINGCAFCINYGARSMKKAGQSDERLWTVAAWREAPFYSDGERAAMALSEAMTRLGDRSGEAVSDELWAEASKHFNEKQLAAIVLWIATTNFFNRINATIQTPADAPLG